MNDFTTERTPKAKGKSGTRGQLTEDKFTALWSNKELQPARVSISVSQSSDFGAVKVSANVSLACDQSETAINKAGELAFYKAHELMTDGWNELCAELQAAAEQETARQGG
jgi:hypothetical protein